MKKYLAFIILGIGVFSNSLFAHDYKVNLVIDKASKNYIKEIEKQTKTLFDDNDNIKFQIFECQSNNCKFDKKGVYLLKTTKIKKKIENSYIITYNFADTKIDKGKVIRATSLSIFEFLKEKKSDLKTIINKDRKNKFVVKKRLKKLDLDQVYNELIQNNYSIKQNQNKKLISSLDIDDAKSDYKPKVNIFSDVVQIDEDRAKYSSGQYSEGTVDMGVKLSQLIYSNSVIKNIEIKKLLDKSIENSTKASTDEILYKTILNYLNIIKTKNSVEIIKTKQEFIKQNLGFAQSRFEIGVKDKSDVFRWQSELADANMELTNAKNNLNSLKTEFASIIQLDKEFDLKNYTLGSKRFKLLQKDAVREIKNDKVQKLLYEEIVSSHPNLKYIKELIEAKKEEKDINSSSRYMPTIAFEAQAKKIIDRYGEARNYPRPWDDEEYQAGINLSIPIYEGGKKSVAVQKNELELINLKLQYEDTKNIINKNLKQNSDALESSYQKLYFAKKSLFFTKANYDSIRDKYKKGEENIVSLLDAQNSYIIARLNKNISEMEYLSNLTSIYYFSGNIDVLVNKNKKENFEKKILKAIDEK